MKIAKLSGKPEIFHTIQGEGLSAGLPSIFLRLSQCNLHCIWCDTDYTWNWEGTRFKHEKDSMPGYKKFRRSEQILECSTSELAGAISAYDCTNLVITGGEPLLQMEGLLNLTKTLREKGRIRHIEVETNGTIVPGKEFDNTVDQYNVSPKLSNSNNSASIRIKADAIKFFASSPKASFKFVIGSPADLDEVESLTEKFSIPPEKVILMPLGTTVKALDERSRWLADICRDRGFGFSDRMHIRIFGNRRGV